MLAKLCGEYRFKLAVWFYFEYYFALLMCLFCGHLTHVTTALPAFFRAPPLRIMSLNVFSRK